ncbi:TPA: hypothetical protein JLH60_004767 [Escherichia coli]|nr:hypothetical protein [Escherichia coli]
MKRYHVISIAVLVGLIVGLSVSKAAQAGEHRDRAICISDRDTVTIYDNGMLYAFNSGYQPVTLKAPSYTDSAHDWAVSVMTNYPEFKCKVLR